MPDQERINSAVTSFVQYLQGTYDRNKPEDEWLLQIQRALRYLAVAYETLSPPDGSDLSSAWHAYFWRSLRAFFRTLPANNPEAVGRAIDVVESYQAQNGATPTAQFIDALYSASASAGERVDESHELEPRRVTQIEKQGGLLYELAEAEGITVRYAKKGGNAASVNEYVFNGPATVMLKSVASKPAPSLAAGTIDDPVEL